MGMTISLLAVEKPGLPSRLDLKPDFKPEAKQLTALRWFWRPGGRVCEIGLVNGLRPLYVVNFEKGMLSGEPLAVGDVILAAGGEPLVSDPTGTLDKKFAEARAKNTKLEITRWRAGVLSRVMVNPVPEAPDFTKGDNHDGWHDWTLGPTGLRGWMFGRNGMTSEARQILVTKVDPGSPADGIMQTNDVILGLDGKTFTSDARIAYAKAIAAAESEAGGGILRLTRWRTGQINTVELKLKVLGTYSDTAPYNCPKSEKVFTQGCAAIAKRGIKGVSIVNDLNALALLASGQPEYRPLLTAYAKEVAGEKWFGEYPNWNYGYATMFLAEYVLATGDQSVLAGLQRITLEIVKSQSAVGTWGHRPAWPNGNINGYGCMNQPGLSLTISLVLARAAGVKAPELDRAIAKASGFLRWYVGKGAIPYGDHLPWRGAHDDGGKTGAAAILFDLMGDREAAEYFAKMSAAGYAERETAHVGNYFCYLWALPSVIRCGPLTSGAYLKEQAWAYDLARCWDGGVIYQGPPQGGQEHGRYYNWDCTGSYLLAFAAPRKSLYLTGKKTFSFPALNRQQTAEVIAAGRDFAPGTEETCYDRRSTEQLLAGLTNWSSAVRYRSAQSLGKREGNFVPVLLNLLAGKDRASRYGALEALAKLGTKADAAAPQLRAALSDSDPWIQSLACSAIPYLSPTAAAACLNDVLKMAAATNPADPRHMADRYAAIALFSPPPGGREPRPILSGPLTGVDRTLLYPAIRSILKNEDSVPRAAVAKVFNRLTAADLAVLLPDIIPAVERIAPSGEMFATGVCQDGLDLLTQLRLREGMQLCATANTKPDKIPYEKRVEYLKRYGVYARQVLPQLKEKRPENKDEAKKFDKLVASLETLTNAPALINLEAFIQANKNSGK